MRIFVDEFVTGGGVWSEPNAGPPQGSLLAEGRAMVRAIATDLLALPGVEVEVLRDSRLAPLHPEGCQVTPICNAADEEQLLLRLAARADWTLLIAPETGGQLLRRARTVEQIGGRLLSPPSELIELAGNKQATADWLRRHRVRSPFGKVVFPGEAAPRDISRAVLKPVDGCGSQAVQRLDSYEQMQTALLAMDGPMRLETYISGLAASVAVLCGPMQRIALPACEQRLAEDGTFHYLGGSTPLAPDLDQRARKLAVAAVATLPSAFGYIGVDLVLGASAAGTEDTVIEINPRLTTSYVGLRAACQDNLARAMLAVVQGEPARLSFSGGKVEFKADGTILTGGHS